MTSSQLTDTQLCVCVSDSPGSPGIGSPAAVPCTRPQYCPPCASLHAAELGQKRGSCLTFCCSMVTIVISRSDQSHTLVVPLFRSSSSSSSSSFFFLPSSCLSESLSLATHWISPPVSCHWPLWSKAAFGASFMRSSVWASARTAARSRCRNS